MASHPQFTTEQQQGIVLAITITSSLSVFSTMCVMFSFLVILLFRRQMASRVSLRLIVLACAFDMIFTIVQLVVVFLRNSTACHALTFLLLSTDNTACLCLALVGFHLVMILVAKVSRPQKLEKFYYYIVGILFIIIILVPIALHGQYHDVQTTCWYNYFFVGRVTHVAKWIWYYGWLLAFCAVATISAVLAIRKVISEHDNFAGVLDMVGSSPYHAKLAQRAHRQNKSSQKKNAQVFREIVCRCVCYPLVPLLCKGCGIGIEIALIRGATISYPVYMVDRVLSCTLGFMVSCIYFTDPVVVASIQDFFLGIRQHFVDDYYVGNWPLDDDYNDSGGTNGHSWLHTMHRKSEAMSDPDPEAAEPIHLDVIPQGSSFSSSSSLQHLWHSMHRSVRPPAKQKRVKKIPLHRVKNPPPHDTFHPTTQGRGFAATQDAILPQFRPYRYPHVARVLHWVCTRLFRLTPACPDSPRSPCSMPVSTLESAKSETSVIPPDSTASIEDTNEAHSLPPPPNLLEPNRGGPSQHLFERRRKSAHNHKFNHRRRSSPRFVSHTQSHTAVELHHERRVRTNTRLLNGLRTNASSNLPLPLKEPKTLLSRLQSRHHQSSAHHHRTPPKQESAPYESDTDAHSTSTQKVDPDFLFYHAPSLPRTPPLDMFAVQLSPPPLTAPKDIILHPAQHHPLQRPPDMLITDLGLHTQSHSAITSLSRPHSSVIHPAHGFHEASTRLCHILNWQQDGAQENRLQERYEPWDMNNMIEKQLCLAEKRYSFTMKGRQSL